MGHNWLPDSNLMLEAEARQRLEERCQRLETVGLRSIQKQYGEASGLVFESGAGLIQNAQKSGGPTVTVNIPSSNSWVLFYAELAINNTAALSVSNVFLRVPPGGSAYADSLGVTYQQFGNWAVPAANTGYLVSTTAYTPGSAAFPPNRGLGSWMMVRPTTTGLLTYELTYGKPAGAYTAFWSSRRLWALVVG